MERRGIRAETAEKFHLGFVLDWKHPKRPSDTPDQRIIIPTGSNSYLARAIVPTEKDKLKVGSVEPFNLQALYRTTPVFITEAEIDAISVEEVGGTSCALGASSMVKKFLSICKEKLPTVPLILSLDNDETGKKAQLELKEGLLALGLSVYEVNTSGKYKDPNAHLVENRTAFTALVNGDLVEMARIEVETEKTRHLKTAVAHHLTAFMGEIAASANAPAIPTGFAELDTALDGGLYEGFYVLGAISSIGKTTFALQLADQIAQHGTDILIFSLEMSRYELMAKSISRLTYEGCNGKTANAKTTRGILSGSRHQNYSTVEKALIQDSVKIYSEYAKRIYIHEGVGSIGIEQIRQEVQRHISFTGNLPVVIIDYLQIVAPFDARSTDKQNTDKAVLELKRLSRDKKVPILAISSFNRDNYTAPVNLASFKESGAIEYSSDVLFGLQFAGMDELSQSEGKRADTIKHIEEKKRADPRKTQLKILKNRNGKIGISLYFDYFPMFNLFKESTSPCVSAKR